MMELADGRTLAWTEWGDLGGRPVVLLNGTPGSRLCCPDVDATEAAGVRLITIDWPGYGRSDPRPGLTTLSWVDDYWTRCPVGVAGSHGTNRPPAGQAGEARRRLRGRSFPAEEPRRHQPQTTRTAVSTATSSHRSDHGSPTQVPA